MLHVFIDSNIYLRFFAYADDALEELEKFHALATTEKIAIYVTQQVKDEVSRNREAEISRAVARFQKSATAPEVPRFALHLPEAKALLKEAKELSDAKAALAKKIVSDIEAGELRADQLVDQLTGVAQLLPTPPQAIHRAQLRRSVGNPPGKPETLGDQINWESLLSGVSSNEDLHLVTNDDDFYSKLENDQPAKFLRDEWSSANGGALFVYRGLGVLAKKHFPDIKVPIDVIKSDAIDRLVNSASFSRTHQQVERLQEIFEELTADDALKILGSMVTNKQISWIADDDDVKAFYLPLYKKFYSKTPVELDEALGKIAEYFDLAPF